MKIAYPQGITVKLILLARPIYRKKFDKNYKQNSPCILKFH